VIDMHGQNCLSAKDRLGDPSILDSFRNSSM
jgi:hypothetical protein